MQREFKISDIILIEQIIRTIVFVKNCNFELFIALKMELSEDFFDELRVQIVVDRFSFAD